MSQPELDRLSARRILSALADGDATDSEAARAFQAWREDDDDARASWHAYQLIGDVMRSDDLAAAPAADASFLVALRARLATEPVVLAPTLAPEELVAQPQPGFAGETLRPAVANARGASWARGRWQAPLAVAAGFIVMIGGINVVRPFGHAGDAAVASTSTSTLQTLAGAGLASAAAPGNGFVATSVQSKAETEQLAPYLAAHRQSTMSGVFQMPGGDIRNVSLVQTAP